MIHFRTKGDNDSTSLPILINPHKIQTIMEQYPSKNKVKKICQRKCSGRKCYLEMNNKKFIKVFYSGNGKYYVKKSVLLKKGCYYYLKSL